MRDLHGWNVVDETSGIAWREYEFARGAWATTLTMRGPDGLIVLSPATKLSPRDYDALAELGPIHALVATNDHHHLGQAGWRAHFPDAESFAPQGCIAALKRKASTVPFLPLGSLRLPAHARWREPAGFVTGETLLSVTTASSTVMFVGDVVANIQRMPGPPLRWLFTLTGSAPGLRPFRLANFSFVRDRATVRAQLLAMIEASPPTLLVPAHGPPIGSSDLVEKLVAQVQKL